MTERGVVSSSKEGPFTVTTPQQNGTHKTFAALPTSFFDSSVGSSCGESKGSSSLLHPLLQGFRTANRLQRVESARSASSRVQSSAFVCGAKWAYCINVHRMLSMRCALVRPFGSGGPCSPFSIFRHSSRASRTLATQFFQPVEPPVSNELRASRRACHTGSHPEGGSAGNGISTIRDGVQGDGAV